MYLQVLYACITSLELNILWCLWNFSCDWWANPQFAAHHPVMYSVLCGSNLREI